MNRADRNRWPAARTLEDLGELTAQWLEGEITGQPGYCDPAPGEDPGPDPETRDLVPVLAACNRAGFVTNGTQGTRQVSQAHPSAELAQVRSDVAAISAAIINLGRIAAAASDPQYEGALDVARRRAALTVITGGAA